MDDVETTTVEETPDPASVATEEEKPAKFSQEDVDRIVSERLEREKRKAERDKEETQRKAREAALQEQEDYKKLAEERKETLSEREKRISELEAVETERDTARGRIEALEERLKGIIKPRLETVPELFRPFVESLSVEEQAEWFEKNSDKLEAPENGRPRGSRPTGRPQGGGAEGEAAKGARESTQRVSRI